MHQRKNEWPNVQENAGHQHSTTMSKFMELIGDDFSAVRSLTGYTSGKTSDDELRDVTYVALDHAFMRDIYEFYKRGDVDITNIDAIKDHFAFSGGVKFFFGKDEIDRRNFMTETSLVSLMRSAREWYHMFGFMGVRDRDAHLDNVASEKDDIDGIPKSAHESSSALLEEARELIKLTMGMDVDPKRKREGAEASSQPTKRTAVYMESGRAPNLFSAPNQFMYTQDAGLGERETLEQKRARTLEETIQGLRSLQVVDLSEGAFYLECDNATKDRRVVFSSVQNGQSSGSIKHSDIDTSVHVMVWPGKMPEWNGQIQTSLDKVIMARRNLDQAIANVAAVDFRNSHPIQLMKQVMASGRTDVDTIIDKNLYGDDAYERQRKEKEDMLQEYRISVAAQISNGKRRDELSRAIADGRMGKTVHDAHGDLRNVGFTRDDFVSLPPGMEPVQTTVATTVSDVNMMRETYRSMLTSCLQIPKQLVDGGSTFTGKSSKNGSSGSGANTSSASAQIGEKMLMLAVGNDRRIMKDMIEGLWNIMYRNIDTAAILALLSKNATATRKRGEETVDIMKAITRRLQNYVELEEKDMLKNKLNEKMEDLSSFNARLLDIREALLSLASMDRRLTVSFDDISYMPEAYLHRAQEIGAISAYEHAQAVRIGLGLEEMTEQQFDALREKKMAMGERQGTTDEEDLKKTSI